MVTPAPAVHQPGNVGAPGPSRWAVVRSARIAWAMGNELEGRFPRSSSFMDAKKTAASAALGQRGSRGAPKNFSTCQRDNRASDSVAVSIAVSPPPITTTGQGGSAGWRWKSFLAAPVSCKPPSGKSDAARTPRASPLGRSRHGWACQHRHRSAIVVEAPWRRRLDRHRAAEAHARRTSRNCPGRRSSEQPAHHLQVVSCSPSARVMPYSAHGRRSPPWRAPPRYLAQRGRRRAPPRTATRAPVRPLTPDCVAGKRLDLEARPMPTTRVWPSFIR